LASLDAVPHDLEMKGDVTSALFIGARVERLANAIWVYASAQN